MKTINETFTDEEYEELIRVKEREEKNWHDFILMLKELKIQMKGGKTK